MPRTVDDTLLDDLNAAPRHTPAADPLADLNETTKPLPYGGAFNGYRETDFKGLWDYLAQPGCSKGPPSAEAASVTELAMATEARSKRDMERLRYWMTFTVQERSQIIVMVRLREQFYTMPHWRVSLPQVGSSPSEHPVLVIPAVDADHAAARYLKVCGITALGFKRDGEAIKPIVAACRIPLPEREPAAK